MMRRLVRGVLATLLLALGPSAAFPDDNVLKSIESQLASQSILRADFRQERRLGILKRPLSSSGTMLLFRGDGVLWRVTEPYEVTYLIRSDEILEWDGGNTPRRITMSAVPAFRLLTEMFLAALGGDLSALRESFEAESLPAEKGWRIRLRPKIDALADVVAWLDVAGKRYVEEVTLEEAKGDSVSFTFSHLDADPKPPSQAERSYFER